jgi:bifunctional enzyme CysN/CysC
METEQILFDRGWTGFVLAGDNIRGGLSADPGSSSSDRIENIPRIGQVAALSRDAGLICITAFISPYATDRERARTSIGEGDSLEVYVKADLATCERRDPKGLFAKARREESKDFTGISSLYKPPVSPSAVVDTVTHSIAACAKNLADHVLAKFGDS